MNCVSAQTHLIVERSPLRVDNHKLSSVLSSLLCSRNLFLTQLRDRPRAVDVRAVRSRSKDGADQRRAILVRARQKRSDGLPSAPITPPSGSSAHVIDERAASDVNVFSVERVLQEPNDVVSYGVLRCESLCPGQELSSIDSSLFHRETIHQQGPSSSACALCTHLKVKPRCMGSFVFLMSDPISVKKASTESAM